MVMLELILGAVCLLCFYITAIIDINIISGISVCSFAFALSIYFKSYALYYTSLMILLVVSLRYYNKKKNKMSTINLIEAFILNLTNILFSIYGIIDIMYFYTAKFNVQRYIPFTRISLIELTPIVYMSVIYLVIILLVLLINNNLRYGLRAKINFGIIKTSIAVISVVLIIIIINAILYFAVHNFPISSHNSYFDGDFLKDTIKSDYKLPRALADCLWFSATTFFTVGYGDMHPVGNIMYLLSIMEMISAYILSIIMVPVLLFKLSDK